MAQTTNELKVAYGDSAEKLQNAQIANGKIYFVDKKLYYDFNGMRQVIDEDAVESDIDSIFENNNTGTTTE